MNVKQKVAALVLICICSTVTKVQSQVAGMAQMPGDNIAVMPDKINWGNTPPGLPAGAQLAVLAGNPGAAGPYTIRLKLPANYIIKPHTHPDDEHITIIEGSCNMGMGEKYDEKTATAMPKGAFIMVKTGSAHYLLTKKPCIVQINGMGPFGITYINPADDPRNKK